MSEMDESGEMETAIGTHVPAREIAHRLELYKIRFREDRRSAFVLVVREDTAFKSKVRERRARDRE